MKYYVNEKEMSLTDTLASIFDVLVKEESLRDTFVEEEDNYEGTIEVYDGHEYGACTIMRCVDPSAFEEMFKSYVVGKVYNIVTNFPSNQTHALIGDECWISYTGTGEPNCVEKPKVTFRKEE